MLRHILMPQEYHIGKMIKKQLQHRQHTVTWFADKLCCNRQNIYDIYSRRSVDTELLHRICIILQHDFFADLSNTLPSLSEPI